MGMFITVVFVFIVIAMGIGAIGDFFKKKTPVVVKEINEVTPPVTSGGNIPTLVTALENEGLFGRVKAKDTDLCVVHNQLISTMAELISREEDIVWLAPKYRLRIRETDDNLKHMGITHTHALLTPTHVIGFNMDIKTGD